MNAEPLEAVAIHTFESNGNPYWRLVSIGSGEKLATSEQYADKSTRNRTAYGLAMTLDVDVVVRGEERGTPPPTAMRTMPMPRAAGDKPGE